MDIDQGERSLLMTAQPRNFPGPQCSNLAKRPGLPARGNSGPPPGLAQPRRPLAFAPWPKPGTRPATPLRPGSCPRGNPGLPAELPRPGTWPAGEPPLAGVPPGPLADPGLLPGLPSPGTELPGPGATLPGPGSGPAVPPAWDGVPLRGLAVPPGVPVAGIVPRALGRPGTYAIGPPGITGEPAVSGSEGEACGVVLVPANAGPAAHRPAARTVAMVRPLRAMRRVCMMCSISTLMVR